MKLCRIKLAGFKSFVEPTAVPLPSGIMAAVGPNGCGKSNLVDGVRWVLGESSAKHLRGGHMSDFLFNGSDKRAPVSRAVAELVFDNHDGALGGPYAAYAEISVKRVMDREGGSDYFLNGSRCRRKDITDLFLGTGLGPRAYAIIEQGMITRLVEARPEDRRLMVEEAAGVTRYKERRKETSRRIERTRENLARVEDVRGELGERLERLGEQAERAREYQRLKERQRELDRQLLGARYRERERKHETEQQEVGRLESELEVARREVVQAESEAERCRRAYEEANEAVSQAQGQYYAWESEVAALERERSQAQEERQRLQEERDAAQVEIEELEQRLTEHRHRIEGASGEEAELRQEAEQLRKAYHEATQALEGDRDRLSTVQAAEAEAREAIQGPAQDERLQEERRQQAERRIAAIDERQETIRDELAELGNQSKEIGLNEAQRRREAAEKTREEAVAELQWAEAEQEQREKERDQAVEVLNGYRQERQRIAAHLESLQSLEARAADLDLGGQRLLEAVGYDRSRLLGGRIRVEAGWETAVEVALAEQLQALVVEEGEWQTWLTWIEGQEAGYFPVIQDREAPLEGEEADSGLFARIECDPGLRRVLADWLVRIGTATDFYSARERAETLAPGEYLITPEGHQVGRDWAVLRCGEAGARGGWLQRRREIEELEARLAKEGQQLREAEKGWEQARQALETARERVSLAREGVDRAEEELRQAREEVQQCQAEIDRLQERRTQLEAEQERLAEERAEEEVARRRAEEAAQAAWGRKRDAEAAWEERRGELDNAREAVQAAEAREREAREALNGLQGRLDSLEAVRQEAERHTQWVQGELVKRRKRLEEIEARLAEGTGPETDVQARLDTARATRAQAESELGERQGEAERAQAALAAAEKQRVTAEKEVEARRSAWEEARQALNKVEAQLEELDTRIREAGITRGEVLAAAVDGADPEPLEKQRTEVEQALNKLGSVNLAAIEEFDETSQRKAHLDEQARDLEEALITLEGAIRRIDAESRTLFRETFEVVDGHFRRLFPTLFGGGRAYLEMTEDDPLETGVEVMAQPPGKKMHSIPLLSGGEKALTAVALTFALFQLNPAPFCILDEVDAPLDEANVARFGQLLQEMAETTQFVVITHNRTTMQVADQLVGVTMVEPGVSRVVAVSVEEGARMVEETG